MYTNTAHIISNNINGVIEFSNFTNNYLKY